MADHWETIYENTTKSDQYVVLHNRLMDAYQVVTVSPGSDIVTINNNKQIIECYGSQEAAEIRCMREELKSR
ncbi:hypothetical protein AGMMS49992_14370 [Clostridia bacterium]|nr:hypothetical protein AGMMS49992_14370 [Clostridia bacterium]